MDILRPLKPILVILHLADFESSTSRYGLPDPNERQIGKTCYEKVTQI